MTKSTQKRTHQLHRHLILNSAKVVDHADLRAQITDVYRAQRALAGPVDRDIGALGRFQDDRKTFDNVIIAARMAQCERTIWYKDSHKQRSSGEGSSSSGKSSAKGNCGSLDKGAS